MCECVFRSTECKNKREKELNAWYAERGSVETVVNGSMFADGHHPKKEISQICWKAVCVAGWEHAVEGGRLGGPELQRVTNANHMLPCVQHVHVCAVAPVFFRFAHLQRNGKAPSMTKSTSMTFSFVSPPRFN